MSRSMFDSLTGSLTTLALIIGAGCGGGTSSTAPAGPGTTTGTGTEAGSTASGPTLPMVQKTLAQVGLDAAALDQTADPCEDFYQFACGGWNASTEIAPDKPLAMRSFVDIHERN